MKTKDLISMRQLREQLLGALIGLGRAELDETAIEVHAIFQITFLHYIGNEPLEKLL